MPVQKITIEEFLELAGQYPVLDVRSPGEYNHAHIPGAYPLPLFTDEERKVVGTTYKQQSREAAIKTGLDYFGVKMKAMIEEAEKIISNRQQAIDNGQKAMGNKQQGISKEGDANNVKPLPIANCLLVHCWRGGMRSAGVAWLLDLYGFKVYTLTGGYKAYRKWVLAQFEKEYSFNIIGGYTGSGKTLLIHELLKQNKTAIDLESLANHKGSAFGGMGKQPGQEMFENSLAQALSDTGYRIPDKNPPYPVSSIRHPGSGIRYPVSNIFLEDESQRIGNLQIPISLWNNMRRSPVYFIDIPFEKRLDYITEEYGKVEKEKLAEAILRIQKRLGGLETKNALAFLQENKYRHCFRILLTYYDKWYTRGLHNRENLSSLLNKIPCASVDTQINTEKLLSCHIVTA